MQDRPTIDELLDAVQGFLTDDMVPMLQGQPRFHARVAANAIAIVRRELELGNALETAERSRLMELLGEEDSRDALNELLARRIRSGDPEPDPARTLQHLRRTAKEKLAVANPKYRAEGEG